MTTRQDIYEAIKRADAKGDSQAIRQLGAFLKTLPPEDDEQAVSTVRLTDDQRRAKITAGEAELAQLQKQQAADQTFGSKAAAVAKGVGEGTATLLSSMAAGPISGIAGAATTAATAPFVGKDKAVEKGANVIKGVGSALTYAPRNEDSQAALTTVGKPFELLAKGGDAAGNVVLDATGSPLAAAATTTAVQSLPALLLRRGKVDPAAASEAAAAAQRAATARAATYAKEKLGVPLEQLSDGLRAQLTTIAQDAKALDGLDPAAAARQARLESLPVKVPATRAQLDRDPVALRNEQNAAATTSGQPIRDTYLAANQALIDNLDLLKGKVSGTGKTAATARTAEQTGESVQGAARAKLDFVKAKVKSLYEKADKAGETTQVVPDESLVKIFDTVGETLDQPHYSYAKSWLQANARKIDAGQMDIRGLEKLRQQAVAKARNGGEDSHYAGELIKAIDEATEGAGGELYKAARAARKQQGLEFQEQGAVADLVENSSRTDRVTALENTTKTILNGSLEDVRKIKRTLLTGGDETTRTLGRKAMRDVRQQVVRDIKDAATKSVATNVDGSPNLSAAGLKEVLDRYGPDKLNEIFGAGTRKQLDKILKAAQDVKTSPPTQTPGSSTVANALAFLEKGLSKLPGGGLVADVARGAAKLKNIGAAGREATRSQTTPIGESLKKIPGPPGKKLPPALIPLSQVGREPKDR